MLHDQQEVGKKTEVKNEGGQKQQKLMNLHLKLKNMITLCPVLCTADVRSANVLGLHISFLSHSLRCLFRLLVGLPALFQVSDRDLQIGLSSRQLFAALRGQMNKHFREQSKTATLLL